MADEAAKENPILIMVNETTGEKFARVVGHKGTKSGAGSSGDTGGVEWLLRDCSDELKTWGLWKIPPLLRSFQGGGA